MQALKAGLSKKSGSRPNLAAENRGIINTHVRALVIDDENPEVLYAGTLYGRGFGGVFRSCDGGKSWEKRSLGLVDTSIEALALLPGDSKVVYAGTHRGLFRTHDAGNHWTRVGEHMFEALRISVLLIPLSRPETLYVGTWQGLYRSRDQGVTWETIEGLSGLKILTLTADAFQEHIMYAGTNQGLYASSDGGTRWNEVNSIFAMWLSAALLLIRKIPSAFCLERKRGYIEAMMQGFPGKKLFSRERRFRSAL
jgi:ligand-binding sensor domain-containing protein